MEQPIQEPHNTSDQPNGPLQTDQKKRRRWIGPAVFFLLFIVALAGWRFSLSSHKSIEPNSNSKANSTKAGSADIRLIATGDFIAHDSLNQQAKQPDGSYNYLQFMSDFKPIFAAADIRFCNQATVSGGAQFGISGYPVFNAPTQFATDMAGVGCNLINTASNHSFDKGQAAIDATLNVWKKTPNLLAVAGENSNQSEHDTISYFNLKGVKFAFLAYTTYNNTTPPNNYGVNEYSESLASTQIKAARAAGAKFIIVSMRWGTEYSPDINSEQKTESQFLADQGVNLILGHGPHELETVKWLSGQGGTKTLVWYSLGNFINTQEPPETLFNGLAVLTIDTKSLVIKSPAYLPIYMHYEWTAAQAASEDLLSRHNLHLYLLENTRQSLIDSNQLKTTVAAQKLRLQSLLNANTNIPLITSTQFYQGE